MPLPGNAAKARSFDVAPEAIAVHNAMEDTPRGRETAELIQITFPAFIIAFAQFMP